MKKRILEAASWTLLLLLLLTLLNALLPSPARAWWGQSQPTHCVQCTVSDDGLTFIKGWEGFSPFIYLDAAGLPTICFGHLIKKGERFNEPMLGDACTSLLRKDTSVADRAVNRNTGYKRKQNQHDALVSFFFNVGESKIVNAKPGNTIKAIRAGKHETIVARLMDWVNVTKAGVREKVRGLIARRASEGIFYQQ